LRGKVLRAASKVLSHATSGHCALRAPTVFLVRIKTIRTKNTVMGKSESGLGLCLYPRSPIVCGCAFHPRTIDDPRGRGAVRASSGAADRRILLRPPLSARDHCALRAPTTFSVRI